MSSEKSFLYELILLKFQDKLPLLQSLTYDELKKLWFDESMTDGVIAELFGISVKEVQNYREEIGLNWSRCKIEQLEQCVEEPTVLKNYIVDLIEKSEIK
jgi:hypothetical protein